MTEETKDQKVKEQEEIKARVIAFNKELIPLLDKYKLGLTATAFIEKGLVLARPEVLPVKEELEKAK